MAHPEWVSKHKAKATELRCIEGRYYLYRISSVWDKEKKRARKITHEMIGRITEQDGLIPRGTKTIKTKKSEDKLTISIRSISSKEYAATAELQKVSVDIIEALQTSFPADWQDIVVLAMNRILYQAPLKNMSLLYEESFISEQLTEVNLNKNAITELLQTMGADRSRVTSFMQKFIDGSENLVFDITDVVSRSKNTKMSARGYNSHHNYDPQVNLFYMFSIDIQMPVFYRIFPGNISGMKALELCIKESGSKNVLVIGDKGFHSKQNIQILEDTGLKFILPLRRDNSDIDYTRLISRDYEEAYDGHFLYQDRPIFYYTLNAEEIFVVLEKSQIQKNGAVYIYEADAKWSLTKNDTNIEINNRKLIVALNESLTDLKTISNHELKIDDNKLRGLIVDCATKDKLRLLSFEPNKKIVVFYDPKLQCEEQASYLTRLGAGHEDYSMNEYKEKQRKFGTIAMMTNLIEQSPNNIYEHYKTRMEVETVFDAYKNLLEADRSYMQSDNAMNAWMFINHVSVMMYYKLLNLIKSKGLIAKISPRDLLLHLSKINKVKINEQWHLAEINSKSKIIFDQLGIHIT